jgi:hypothetical protein
MESECPKAPEECEHSVTRIRNSRLVECLKPAPMSCEFAMRFGYSRWFCRCPRVPAARGESVP